LGHQVVHLPMGRALRGGKFSYQGILLYSSGEDAFSESVALEAYTDWRSDLLIFLKEVWVLSYLHRYGITFVPYCPVDHSPVSPSITSRLHTAFRILAPSRFAMRELKQAGIDPDTVDVEALVDPTLTYHENRAALAESLGLTTREYEGCEEAHEEEALRCFVEYVLSLEEEG